MEAALPQTVKMEELVFELGLSTLALEVVRTKDHFFENGIPRSDFKGVFEDFKIIASKLGIDIPNLPLQFTSNRETFFIPEIYKVRRHIANSTDYVRNLFQAGIDVQHLRVLIMSIQNCKSSNIPFQSQVNELPEVVRKIRSNARSLGVDLAQMERELDDICHNYADKNEDDLKHLVTRLKVALCSEDRDKRSEVDPTRVITDNTWAISLLRLPDSSNAEHAFLVLEGKTGRKSKIWFADFVAKTWLDAVSPGTEEGKIRMEEYESEGVAADPTSKLLFKCQKKMMAIRAGDRLLFSTWSIAKTTADKLIQNIEEHQRTPPKFHIAGDQSVLAVSSATSSSNPTGHNCFTFAKMILRDLNDPIINLPEDSLRTWIKSATSRFLVDKQMTRRKWYEKSSFLLMIGFLAGVTVTVAFFLLQRIN